MQGIIEDNNIKYSIKEIKELDNGAKYKVSIKVPFDLGWVERMKFVIESTNLRSAFPLKHIKNEKEYAYFETEVDLKTKALYKYYFTFEVGDKFIYFKKENNHKYNSISDDEKWSMSVNFKVPEWAQGKIMYHIFVDRFNKGRKEDLPDMPRRIIHKDWHEDMMIGPDKDGLWNTDFYGGDLKGIEDKLDYIKSLGVSILYLSPIVYSQSNHRYDTSDYEMVDPYCGNNEDLKRLCDKAHKMGMKVILDAVFNHTGNDSKYFNEYGSFNTTGAYQSKESPYYPFYRKHYFNNQTYFDYWWGMPNLPVCNGNSIEWQNYIYGENGIIDKWFKLGIDGLRLDVADELTDEFIEGIRKAVKRNKEDGFILGEVWKNPWRMGRSYIDSGKGMDSVMNYLLVDALIRYYKYKDVYKLNDVFYQLINEYSPESLNSAMNFTSTHDISRAINIFGTNEFNGNSEWAWNLNSEDRNYQNNYKMTKADYEFGKTIYKNYIFNLAFLPGNLSIFYGDEIGMQGLGNLSNRKPFTWDNIDYDLLNYFKTIGYIRNKEQELAKSSLKILDINNKYLMYERINELSKYLVIINRSHEKINTPIPEDYLKHDKQFILKDSNKEIIDSYGGLVLKKRVD